MAGLGSVYVARGKSVVQRTLWTLGFDVSRLDPRRSLNRLVRAQLAQHRINCVVDVGAHRGEYGGFLRSLGYHGHIISFEPTTDPFARLQQLADRDPRWDAHRIALGRRQERKVIHVAKGTDLSSFLKPDLESLTGWASEERQIACEEEVQVERLDHLFEACTHHIAEPRVFLKLDTQGWDIEVLAGATGMLDRVFAVQTEISMRPLYQGMPDFSEAVKNLQRLGFEVVAFFPIASVDWAAIEFDCIAIRRPELRGDPVIATPAIHRPA